MAIHVAQMASLADKSRVFAALTVNSALAMGLQGYGLEKGCHADFVVLQARDAAEALRLKAVKLAVVRRGRVIARTQARVGELLVAGRERRVDASEGFAPEY